MLPLQRLHPVHRTSWAHESGRYSRRAAETRSERSAPRRERRRGVRVHAQGPPHDPHRVRLPRARAARSHRRDPRSRLPGRRRPGRSLRARRPRPRRRTRRALPRRARARGRRDRPRRRRRGRSGRRSCPPPTAISTSSTASSSISSTEVYDRALPRAARCAARRSGASRRLAPRAVHPRRPSRLPRRACSSTRSRSPRSPTSSASCTPSSTPICCSPRRIVHDLGRTREFTYGAEFGLTDEGRLLGHIVIGRADPRPTAPRDLGDERRLALLHCVLCHHGAERRPAGGSGRPRRSRCTGSTHSTRTSRACSSTGYPPSPGARTLSLTTQTRLRISGGAARAWWPIRSSKPAGRGSPPLGRFDSFAASWLQTERFSRGGGPAQDGALFLTAAFTGLRMGELLALVRSVPMVRDVATALG